MDKLHLKYMLSFTIISVIVMLLFKLDRINKSNTYIDKQTKNYNLKFKTLYYEYKTISNLIFQTKINKPEIIDLISKIDLQNPHTKRDIRNKLYELLKDDYEIYKKNQIKQLHFHLQNNESFLRMNKSKMYGDNLKGIRQTVEFVNKNKKYIEGFEEGRIYNGFRFVYPLFKKDTYIGSVEISLSTLAFIENLYKIHNIETQLIMFKTIVNKKLFKSEKLNYVNSTHDDFYFEKNIIDEYPLKLNLKRFDISEKIKKKKPFSIYIKNGNNYISTFIPLVNPVTKQAVGSLILNKKDKYIENIYSNSYFLTLMTLLLIGILFIYIYELNKTKKYLDKRVKNEVTKNRKKDIQILNQAKMLSIGETLNNIAHQWRQPLSIITTSASGLKLENDLKTISKEHINLFTNNIISQATYLSNTIDSFRALTEDDSAFEYFCIQDEVEKAIKLIKHYLITNKITLNKKFDEKRFNLKGSRGLFTQVIIYVLNNAIDAITLKDSNIKFINISIFSNIDTYILKIEDSGTGIDKKIINKIFEPYFTTKHNSRGTGIGLYASYEIITDKFNGKIKAKNTANGAMISINIPKNKEN